MSVSHDIKLKRAVKFYERRCPFRLTKFCIRLESPGYMTLERFFYKRENEKKWSLICKVNIVRDIDKYNMDTAEVQLCISFLRILSPCQ